MSGIVQLTVSHDTHEQSSAGSAPGRQGSCGTSSGRHEGDVHRAGAEAAVQQGEEDPSLGWQEAAGSQSPSVLGGHQVQREGRGGRA